MFDLYQQRRIKQTNQQISANAQENEQRHRRSRDDIDQLHARIDRLVMINEALWILASERLGLSGDELSAVIGRLDAEDGATDGRRQPVAADCQCGAKVHPRARCCQFCGAPPPARSVFDAV